MIAQVVVRVGNQHVEDQPPPKGVHILPGPSAVLAQEIHELHIAVHFMVRRAQCSLGGEKRNATVHGAIEAAEQ